MHSSPKIQNEGIRVVLDGVGIIVVMGSATCFTRACVPGKSQLMAREHLNSHTVLINLETLFQYLSSSTIGYRLSSRDILTQVGNLLDYEEFALDDLERRDILGTAIQRGLSRFGRCCWVFGDTA